MANKLQTLVIVTVFLPLAGCVSAVDETASAALPLPVVLGDEWTFASGSTTFISGDGHFEAHDPNADLLVIPFSVEEAMTLDRFRIDIFADISQTGASPGVIFALWKKGADSIHAGLWLMAPLMYGVVIPPEQTDVPPVEVIQPCGSPSLCGFGGIRINVPADITLTEGDWWLVASFTEGELQGGLTVRIDEVPPLSINGNPLMVAGCDSYDLGHFSATLAVHGFTGPGISVDSTVEFETENLVFGVEYGRMTTAGFSEEVLVAPDGKKLANHAGQWDDPADNWDGEWIHSQNGAGRWSYEVTGAGHWINYPGLLVCSAPAVSHDGFVL